MHFLRRSCDADRGDHSPKCGRHLGVETNVSGQARRSHTAGPSSPADPESAEAPQGYTRVGREEIYRTSLRRRQ
jgi:hypothetical protein